MLHRVDENSVAQAFSADEQQRESESSPEGQSEKSPTTATTTPAWGKAVSGTTTSTPKPAGLAEIIAEQNEDRRAAHAVYGNDESLVDVEAEQQRLLLSKPSTRETEESKRQDDPFSEEDEILMLELVMRQSLAEYTENNKATESKEVLEETVASDEAICAWAAEDARETVRPSEMTLPPERAASMQDLLLDDSSHSASSQNSNRQHRSEPALNSSASALRPSLGDREFSRRTLREIERTAIVIDNPHADAEEKRRRLHKTNSLQPPPSRVSGRRLGRRSESARHLEIERTAIVIDNPHADAEEKRRRLHKTNSLQPPPSRVSGRRLGRRSESARHLSTEPPDRRYLMNEAKKHLSSREIMEIEQALRDADDVHDVLESPHIPYDQKAFNRLSPSSRHNPRSPHTRASLSPIIRCSPRCRSPLIDDSRHTTGSTTSVRPSSSIPAAPFHNEHATSTSGDPANFLSEVETAAIEAALREADAREEEESLMLAFQMHQEELRKQQQAPVRRQPQGNVRTMTRAELDYESQNTSGLYQEDSSGWIGAVQSLQPPPLHPLEQQERAHAPGVVSNSRPPARHPLEEDTDEGMAGFRMNAASAHQWARRDRNTIIGPNNEVRTKHDVHVQGQANAEWLGVEEDDFGLRVHVGNQAFNSFRKSMKRTTKGVAANGTGRAGSDTDAIKGKAMDPHVRLQISRAINAGLIENCNGAVKQGKEAIVYHADQGAGSQGYDVAVKVFKRITEFRGRGDYVDGDPRYAGRAFRRCSEREQLELWTEKEFRNLVRASRAKVPVPTPLHYKENIIFMRFMGNNGWPAPQIREIDMRKGNKKWDVLYTQVMESIRRLYVGARLVHGDLSEFNVLLAPAFQVDNAISSVEDTSNDLQAVLIDFGQAVDVRHPNSMNLLRRDLDRVRTFFKKNGVKTLRLADAVEFVVDDFDNEEAKEFHGSSDTVGSGAGSHSSFVDANVG